jgi:hypothetical protein
MVGGLKQMVRRTHPTGKPKQELGQNKNVPKRELGNEVDGGRKVVAAGFSLRFIRASHRLESLCH